MANRPWIRKWTRRELLALIFFPLFLYSLWVGFSARFGDDPASLERQRAVFSRELQRNFGLSEALAEAPAWQRALSWRWSVDSFKENLRDRAIDQFEGAPEREGGEASSNSSHRALAKQIATALYRMDYREEARAILEELPEKVLPPPYRPSPFELPEDAEASKKKATEPRADLVLLSLKGLFRGETIKDAEGAESLRLLVSLPRAKWIEQQRMIINEENHGRQAPDDLPYRQQADSILTMLTVVGAVRWVLLITGLACLVRLCRSGFPPQIELPRDVAAMRQRWKPLETYGVWQLAFLLTAFFVPGIIFFLGTKDGFHLPEALQRGIELLLYAAPILILGAWLLPKSSKARKKGARRESLTTKVFQFEKSHPSCYSLVLAAFAVATIARALLEVLPIIPGQTLEVRGEFFSANWMLTIVFLVAALVVVAPVVEEVVFRGYLLSAFRNRFTFPVAALLISALYALVHHPGVAAFLLLFLHGVLLSLLAARTASIKPGIRLLAILNLMMLAELWVLYGVGPLH